MSTQEVPKRHSLLGGVAEDRPGRAASLMVGALFLLGFQDSIVKLASDSLSLWQFQMFRAAINLILLILLTRVIWGTGCPPPKRFWAVALRSLFLVGAMLFYFGGVPFLNLSDIAAGLVDNAGREVVVHAMHQVYGVNIAFAVLALLAVIPIFIHRNDHLD